MTNSDSHPSDQPIEILLIEDNPGDVYLLQETLAQAASLSFTLTHARRLSEGLHFLSEQDFAVILLDLGLPDSRGVDTVIKLLAQMPEVPIVVLTDLDDEKLAMQAVAQGAQDYLVKGTFDGGLLVRSINYAIARGRLLTNLAQSSQERMEEALQESKRRLEETLAELQQTQQHLIHLERLRALGQMASGIIHDFNNAITPILGFCDMLLSHPEYLDNQEKVLRYLKLMNIGAQDGANIVSRLQEVYRQQEGDEITGSVDLNRLVEQVISLAEPKWKHQARAGGRTIKIVTDLGSIPSILGNQSALREMLTNLLFNAIDAVPEGGTITLQTFLEGTEVALVVQDTGIGMVEAVRRRCLDPFFSTKEERGTGLGLAMVQGIVQQHGGRLEIESEPGRGTTFITRFPAYKELPATAEPQIIPAPTRPLHALIVEDEPLVRQLIIEYFTDDGHTVEVAANGREALAKFQPGRFDVVVTDQSMPEMSGVQLAAAIEEIAPDQVIILLTGFANSMHLFGGQPTSVNLIVNKPINLIKFRQALAQIA